MSTTQVTDHTAQAIARLHEKHKGLTNIEALVAILCDPVQDIESALWQLFTERLISTAVGTQLDVLGRIAVQPRNGLSDDDYRRYIRARIATSKSKGLWEDVITVARLVIDDGTTTLSMSEGGATLLLDTLGTEISDDLATILIEFLRDTKSGGVRLLLYYGDDDGEAFEFGPLAVQSTAILSTGATSVIVDSTEGFEESGTLAWGTSYEEATYTSKDTTTFYGLSTRSFVHSSGQHITQVDDNEGFGDTGDSEGGAFRAVIE